MNHTFRNKRQRVKRLIWKNVNNLFNKQMNAERREIAFCFSQNLNFIIWTNQKLLIKREWVRMVPIHSLGFCIVSLRSFLGTIILSQWKYFYQWSKVCFQQTWNVFKLEQKEFSVLPLVIKVEARARARARRGVPGLKGPGNIDTAGMSHHILGYLYFYSLSMQDKTYTINLRMDEDNNLNHVNVKFMGKEKSSKHFNLFLFYIKWTIIYNKIKSWKHSKCKITNLIN